MFTQIGRRGAEVISFNRGLPCYPDYCLPSLAAIDKKGILLLGTEAGKHLSKDEWDSGMRRFKVVVAGKHDPAFIDIQTEEAFETYKEQKGCGDDLSAERLTAVYLAYAMHRCRLEIEKREKFKDCEIDMAFNICMPIDHIENNEVKAQFERLFSWAEAIESAWREEPEGFNPLDRSYALESTTIADVDRRVFAVPESVASMVSYLISLEKREGLHAVIDLGAGTTDVSICNIIMPSGEARSCWFAASNIPRGAAGVERGLASLVKELGRSSKCTQAEILKCLDCAPPRGGRPEGLSRREELIKAIILRELRALRDSNDYRHTWRDAYSHLMKHSLWDNVQVFLCGGGAGLPYADFVFSIPALENIDGPYPVKRVPVPDDFGKGDNGIPFCRMCVAYGLARPLPEFRDYALPKDVGDHTPPPLPVLRLDHRDIYLE